MKYSNKPIDREYAIKQAELGYKESQSDAERETFKCLKEFLTALPSPEDLEEHVYCTKCEHFVASEDDLSCPYSDLCHFWNTEDSVSRRIRWCYSPREV